LTAVPAGVTTLPPASAEVAVQLLVAAICAAVAAPASAGIFMFAMVGWGEPLLATLRAAMEVQLLPPSKKQYSSY